MLLCCLCGSCSICAGPDAGAAGVDVGAAQGKYAFVGLREGAPSLYRATNGGFRCAAQTSLLCVTAQDDLMMGDRGGGGDNGMDI